MHGLNREGKTIIFITHHMEEAAQANRIVVLNHGHLALDGPPEDIFSQAGQLHMLGLGLPDITSMAVGLSRVFPQVHHAPSVP